MTRVAPKTGELIEATPRKAMTPKRRRDLLDAYFGKCARCGEPITQPGWVANHITPLAQGGADDLSNLEPLHKPCDNQITPADISRIAETKRQAKMRLDVPREVSKNPIRSRGFQKPTVKLKWPKRPFRSQL